jgi:hypothetical protein
MPRTYSFITIAALTATLNDRVTPNIGIWQNTVAALNKGIGQAVVLVPEAEQGLLIVVERMVPDTGRFALDKVAADHLVVLGQDRLDLLDKFQVLDDRVGIGAQTRGAVEGLVPVQNMSPPRNPAWERTADPILTSFLRLQRRME